MFVSFCINFKHDIYSTKLALYVVRCMSGYLIKYIVYLLLYVFSCSLNAKEFVIGVQDIRYYPLYDFPKPSHTKDLLDAFAKSKGYKFTYLPLPILRFDKWLEDEDIDFKYPDNRRWFPDKPLHTKLTFSKPTIELIACAMTKRNKAYSSRKEVKRLGSLLGFHPSLWVDLINSGNTRLIESPSTIDIIKQTLFGSVDAINLEPSVVNYHLKKLNKEGELIINKNINYQVYTYHLSTINHPEIITEFNHFLNKNAELLVELKSKYNIVDVTPYR